MKARLAATKARASVGTIYDWRCTDCGGASTSATGSRSHPSKHASASVDIIDLTLDSDEEDDKPAVLSVGPSGARMNATAVVAGGQAGSPTALNNVLTGRSVKTPLSPPPSRSPSVAAAVSEYVSAAANPNPLPKPPLPIGDEASAAAPHLSGGLTEPHQPPSQTLKHGSSTFSSRTSISRSLMSQKPGWEPPSLDRTKLASVPSIDFSNMSRKRGRRHGRYSDVPTGDPREGDSEETEEPPAKRRRTTIAGIPHATDDLVAGKDTGGASIADAILLGDATSTSASAASVTVLARASNAAPGSDQGRLAHKLVPSPEHSAERPPTASDEPRTSFLRPSHARSTPPPSSLLSNHAPFGGSATPQPKKPPSAILDLTQDGSEDEANCQRRELPPAGTSPTIASLTSASPTARPPNTITLRVTPQPIRSLVPIDPAQRAHLQQRRAEQSPQRARTLLCAVSPSERSKNGSSMPPPPVSTTSGTFGVPRPVVPRKRTRSISPTSFETARTSKRPAPEVVSLPRRSNSVSTIPALPSTSLSTRLQPPVSASSSTTHAPSLTMPPPASTTAPSRRHLSHVTATMLQDGGEHGEDKQEFEYPTDTRPSTSSFFGSASQRAKNSWTPLASASAAPSQFIAPPVPHSALVQLDDISNETGTAVSSPVVESYGEQKASDIPSPSQTRAPVSTLAVIPPPLSPASNASSRADPFIHTFSQPQPHRPPSKFRRDASVPPIAFLADDDLLSSPEPARVVPTRILPTSKKAKPKRPTQETGEQESEKTSVIGTKLARLGKIQAPPSQTAVAKMPASHVPLPMPPPTVQSSAVNAPSPLTHAATQPPRSMPVLVPATTPHQAISTPTVLATTFSRMASASKHVLPPLKTTSRETSTTPTIGSRSPPPAAAAQPIQQATSLHRSSVTKPTTIRVPNLMAERKAETESAWGTVSEVVARASSDIPAAQGASLVCEPSYHQSHLATAQPRPQQFIAPARPTPEMNIPLSPNSAQSTQIIESSVAEEREFDFDPPADERSASISRDSATCLDPMPANSGADNDVTKSREIVLLTAERQREVPQQEPTVMPAPVTASSSMPRQVMRKRVPVPKLRRPGKTTTITDTAPQVQAAAVLLSPESTLKPQPAPVPRVVALKEAELAYGSQVASSSRPLVKQVNEPAQRVDTNGLLLPGGDDTHVDDPPLPIPSGSTSDHSSRRSPSGSVPPSGPVVSIQQTSLGSMQRARSVRPTPRPVSNNIDDVLAYLNNRRLENPVPLRNATPIRKPQQPAEKLKQKRRTEVQDEGPLDLRLFDLIRHASRRTRIRRGIVGDNNTEMEVGETVLIAGGMQGAQWKEAARLAARPRATD